MSTNDNEPGSPIQMPRPPEAQGQAALVLVESLIHGLIAKSVLTTEDSLEIVTSAVDVQADYAAEAVDGLADEMRQSQGLLTVIANSLMTDIVRPIDRTSRPSLVEADDLPAEASSPPTKPPHRGDGSDE